MTARTETWITGRYCGVRHADRDGWTLALIPDGLENVGPALAALSLTPGTETEIRRMATSRDVDGVTILSFDDAFDVGCDSGWTYDYAAQCWRAPDEATLPPPAASHAGDLEVTFQPPDAGCLETRFTVGSQSFEYLLSSLFDPLPDLVAWLERVASGANSRFCCNVEGSEIEFHLWQQDADLHLLIAHNTRIGRYEEINALVSREAFVRSIYGALIRFWESPALTDNWDQWARYTEQDGVEVNEHGYELHPYPLRSPMLDALIAGEPLCP